MGKSIVVLSNCLGLANKVDPTRIVFDPEKGLSELAVAYNVDIDGTGRINRAKGYTKVVMGSSHSLFPFSDYCLVVCEGQLSILNRDYSLVNLLEVDPDRRVSYVAVWDRVYFTNGHNNGYIQDRTLYNWELNEYVGPSTSKYLSGPPLGHLLELYSGYMFIAEDNVLWNSMPFNYHSYDLNKGNVLFPSRIRMVKAVRDGLYVSDLENTYFLAGSPKEFIQTKVADYPVIEGTEVVVDGREIGNGDIRERVVMWTSTEGICIGGPEGFFMNLTERKLKYPSAAVGAGVCIDNRYVSTLKAPEWSSADGFV